MNEPSKEYLSLLDPSCKSSLLLFVTLFGREGELGRRCWIGTQPVGGLTTWQIGGGRR